MADLQKYRVLRIQDGDRTYVPGDIRELTAADAKHLLDLGVLEAADEATQKAEPAPENKAESTVDNKAEVAPKTTRRTKKA